MKFTHLHTHSHYSLLEALPKIPDLVKKAKSCDMDTLALTDAGNLYGAIEFYKECKDNGIKPIIGVDTYLALRTRHDKEARIDNVRSRLILLAENLEGYKNLLKLVTVSYLEGFYYKPRLDYEALEEHKQGLIAISPSFSGDVVKALSVGDEKRATELVDWYKKTFGPEGFYLEITHHPEVPGHEDKMKSLVEFARRTNTPIMAAHDVYYLEPDDRQARETMISIQSNIGGRDSSFDGEDENFSFIDQETAEKLFQDTPDALENTRKIANACNLELELGKWVFPDFVIESGKNADDELRDVVMQGFEWRGVPKEGENLERAEYELGVIKKKGYSPYFLVVSDLLRFARENGILANIRGSVTGSMVTYLAGITTVNPLEYNIPFERFLNPDRPSAPDIDMDFADNRRDEVIEYARVKYGRDKVAQIGTFGTMMARGSVRDVTRALGFPYSVGDQAAKLIPFGAQGFPMTIERAMKESPDFKKLYEEDNDVKTIVEMAKKIEGCARHISVHAAGVVISPTAITDYTALQYDTKGDQKVITQYDMYSIEEAGLLKFDFLGLKNLSIIADTFERVEKIEGKKLNFDDIPIDDKKTFQMLARGETEGTFQLNGDAMTKFLMELKPSTIHDIHAMVALYRPGPMQFIPLFIERKHNPSLVSYMDPALEPILEKTYGVLVYQDDLLLIARNIAGYSWGEVDKFRKAVGKKIPEVMAEQKEKFIKGCIEHSGWPEKKAQELWSWIEPFAAYGFNKAHSVSYGHVAYKTAYLKANYPEIYMSAVLSADSGDVEKIGEHIHECKRMGIDVLPPSINESFSQFSVIPEEGKKGYKIRFGLTTIKNFGGGISSAITAERKRGGKFKSLADFLHRVTDKNLNRRSLESLIKVGAMDEFEERGKLLANIELLIGYHKESANKPENQESLFGLMEDTETVPSLKLEEAPVATQEERLAWEKELLGLYISGHPLEKYREKLEAREVNIKKLETFRENTETVIAGIVEDARDVLTKKGDRMIFLRLSDFSGAIEIAVFPRVVTQFRELLVPDSCIAIKGKVSRRNGETSFIADKIKPL